MEFIIDDSAKPLKMTFEGVGVELAEKKKQFRMLMGRNTPYQILTRSLILTEIHFQK
jgi:hypothetical protein